MKKFFTLLCAVALVVSASATNELKASYFQAKKAQQTALKNVKIDAPKKGEVSLFAPKAHSLKSVNATADNVLAVNGCQAMYYGSMSQMDPSVQEGEWQIAFFNGQNLVAVFDILATDGQHLVGSYASNANYGAFVVIGTDTIDATTSLLNIVYNTTTNMYEYAATINAAGVDYTLNLTIAQSDFNAIDYLNYLLYQYGMADESSVLIKLKDKPFVVTNDTIELQFPGWSSLDYYMETADYYASGENGDYAVSVDWFPVTAGSPVGSFTNTNDFDLEYCMVYDYATKDKMDVLDAKANVTLANDTVYVEAWLLAEDGNVYHFILKNYVITPKETINVVFTETEVSDEYFAEYGVYAFAGDGDDYLASFFIYVDPTVVGTYSAADLDEESLFGDYSTMRYLQIYDATFTIVASGSSYALQASVLCTNEKQYNFTIAPQATPLENIFSDKAAAQKAIKNGQLVIEMGGKKFNVQGAQL